ncbi:MBL fold metallo-hydrolase [Aliikangiella sp. IMCC44653]
MSAVRVKEFYHQESGTFSYVIYDLNSQDAVIIDPVYDFQQASSQITSESVETVLTFISDHQLKLHYTLETHAHADHISAAHFIKQQLATPIVIGHGITQVQANFKTVFNLKDDFLTDGSDFDLLVKEGDIINAGSLKIKVLATPGHTNDSVTYLIADCAFIGDTLFHPDTGTARCDFPGGNAKALYQSIQKILSLPSNTRLFLCHDYPSNNRKPTACTSIQAQQTENKHLANISSVDEFVKIRTDRDRSLDLPQLIIPSIQINIRAGKLPQAESNQVSYLKYPINLLTNKKD